MPLIIKEITKNSLADQSALKVQDTIVSINDCEINDLLDLQYYSNEERLKIIFIDKKKNRKTIKLRRKYNLPLGIVPIEKPIKMCINKCIFCFVDQMPSGLRKSLYVKDDDPVQSFIFGNFISLTNINPALFSKICEQHLSPLYISVHSTDPVLHNKLFRHSIDNFNILSCLKKLSDNNNNISFHTQIVIMPGYNDGDELIKTLNDLTEENLNTLSIGLVPVGLTKFRRNGLVELREFKKKDAEQTIEIAENLKKNKRFSEIYCSDEIFIKAEKSIPSLDYYNDFEQIENGIGMVRSLLTNWENTKYRFIDFISDEIQKIVFLTGTSAYSFINKISLEINQSVRSEKTQTIAIRNDFFGENVTVSGLLTAEDIFSQVDFQAGFTYAFSSNILNFEGFTIDNYSTHKLINFQNQKKIRFLIVDELFREWFFLEDYFE